MVDVREDILARLVEVVGSIPGMRSVHRNNVDITEDQLPAVCVFDADEDIGGALDLAHPPNSPMAVHMTPEIVIAEKTSGQVGSELTALRRELIKRVLTDIELIQIVNAGRGGNGAIRYLGCQTDVGWMRSLHGALRAQFVFKYWLKPNEL